MASLNAVYLMGNLTHEPELRYLPSGQAVTTFPIGVNRVFISQSGEKKQEATFVRIVVWGKRAETCNEFLSKGSLVCVEGRLRSRSWQTQDGQKRSTIEVVARNVQFLSRLKKQAQAQGEEEAAQVSPEEPSVDVEKQDDVPF